MILVDVTCPTEDRRPSILIKVSKTQYGDASDKYKGFDTHEIPNAMPAINRPVR